MSDNEFRPDYTPNAARKNKSRKRSKERARTCNHKARPSYIDREDRFASLVAEIRKINGEALATRAAILDVDRHERGAKRDVGGSKGGRPASFLERYYEVLWIVGFVGILFTFVRLSAHAQ